MLMLIVGLATVAVTALVAGYLLFGVRPKPVTDSSGAAAALRFIPLPPLREVFGLWAGRRNRDGVVAKLRSALLLLLALACLAAAMAVIAGLIGFAIGLLTEGAIG
ncbi:MAG: hypothetical protein R2754_18265 [Microthrixaceae bacterium]